VLEYSAHPAAQDAATALAAELAQRGEAVRIAVVHRVGTLAVGDLAVVAAVSAEHRAEAFTVCRELIDRFKAEVPVWKHQHFTDGGDEWVGVT
ncbi:MAG: molybdenum cofactor biosynthesis protein MoaE, partial [Candidatus Lutibacillus vidarii]